MSYKKPLSAPPNTFWATKPSKRVSKTQRGRQGEEGGREKRRRQKE
jgi:hypothetical protein